MSLMSIEPPPADYSVALIDGPWRHDFVSANGSRFHVALAGPKRTEKPLVVLVHGLGQFWWTWRHQIEALADAGYAVAAIDLRGTAASDKPPTGYDTPTRTRDVAGIVRSLGHHRAIVIGHGYGGEVAWAMGALQPAVTAGVVALASPHPAHVHAPWLTQYTPAARKFLSLAQVPFVPERKLQDGDLLAKIFATGASRPLPAEAVDLYQTVMRIPFAAHCTAETPRWMARSTIRPDGMRYAQAVRHLLTAPGLQVHGSSDGFIRRNGADLDGAAFARDFRFEVLYGVGHYLPEEAPGETTELILDWLPTVT
jgi:pimeloyl-ACP methyl ester carboxylesterase